MPQTELKAVTDARPGKLSFDEMEKLARDLTNMICDDDDAVNTLLVFAAHLMEHPHDAAYIDSLGMALARHLHSASFGWMDEVLRHAEEYRRGVLDQQGGAK